MFTASGFIWFFLIGFSVIVFGIAIEDKLVKFERKVGRAIYAIIRTIAEEFARG